MRVTARPQPGALAFPLTALGGALALYAILVVATIIATGGVFEYPLDDPYIHLALAEQIAQGNYGINAGEMSSPGSSPLFPLLLTPFAGSPVQRFLPALWNLVGLAVSAWLWGRLLFEAGYARVGWRRFGYAIAGLGPAVLLMPQVALLGMEHALHAAAALAVVLGLMRHFAGERPGGPTLVVVGALLSSAFRFEAMALGLLAGVALFFTGRRGAGVLAALCAFLPIIVFMGVLTSLGLDPTPSSVQVKLEGDTVGVQSPIASFFLDRLLNLLKPGGILVVVLIVSLLVMRRVLAGVGENRFGWLAVTVIGAGVAHLLVGQIGWMNRYEHYLVVGLVASLVALLPRVDLEPASPRTSPPTPAPRPAPRPAFAIALAAIFIAPFYAYQPGGTVHLPGGAQAIFTQQGQMARFARDVLDAPVAVNDIGRVAWRNPNYVLDLWGLASSEAREIRLGHPTPGWTGNLTEKHDVPVAMVYDHWFQGATGPDWVRMGQFELTVPTRFLGGPAVGFYATTPASVDKLRAKLLEWIPTLAPDSRFIWEEGMEP